VPAKSPVFDPAKPVKGTKPKRKTQSVVQTARTKSENGVSTEAVPTKAVRKTKRVLPTKPASNTRTKSVVAAKSVSKTKTKPVVVVKSVSKTKAKPVDPTKPVPKPKKKPVTLAKPKVKPVPIAVPTKGAKTMAFVAAAKSPAKTSAAKSTLVAGPNLCSLANHRLRRSATGLFYCAFCDR
jgi:hypothetical protein